MFCSLECKWEKGPLGSLFPLGPLGSLFLLRPLGSQFIWGLNLPSSAAHAAHSASHHLIGYGVSLSPIDNQRASCLLAGSVIVESTLGSNIKRSSCEDQISVGVDCVCIA